MKQMIQEYEELYKAIAYRIYVLRQKYKKEELQTMELENLKARIDCLEQERFELVQSIHEMRMREIQEC